MIRRLVYIIAVMLALSGNVSAQAWVVINEVMANEPGTAVSLEWIELYNNSSSNADLQWYDLRVNHDSANISYYLADDLPPWTYLVLCRDLDRFEEHWGDSSGAWADHPSENYLIGPLPPIPQQIPAFPTGGGRIELHRLQTMHSELSWNESGIDGHSWERVHPSSEEIVQSQDPSGSTPGRINSLTPMGTDLALTEVNVTAVDGDARMVFRITNRGLTTVNSSVLDVMEFDANAPDSGGRTFASESVGPVDSGFTDSLVGQIGFLGVEYQKLIARIRGFSDDRPNNNQIVFVAPGDRFPSLRLSEVQAHSLHPQGGEWVEIENTADTAIDLAGWRLGDSIGYVDISSESLTLPADAYLVLVQDAAGFRVEFPLYSGLLHEPETWRGFNNSSDSVRLLDLYGLQADRFYYDDNANDGRTWIRTPTGEWSRSENEGGTPGETNRVRVDPEGTSSISIEIDPRIVSPDGDGRDDSTVIVVTTSGSSSYVLRLYDSQGRLVKTFEDHSPDLARSYSWHGRNDSGRRLPIGIYILYFEAVGVESIKKTIVLAR